MKKEIWLEMSVPTINAAKTLEDKEEEEADIVSDNNISNRKPGTNTMKLFCFFATTTITICKTFDLFKKLVNIDTQTSTLRCECLVC